MIDTKIIDFSNTLERLATSKAECYPVDRYFLNSYIDRILEFDRNAFLLCNFERMSNTYTVQLLLCLPELWETITVEDLIDIVSKFTNIYSYYTLIEFTYKYVEVDVIETILNLSFVSSTIKKSIIYDYLIAGLYLNLIKTDGDYFFFNEGMYGVSQEDWFYAKQRLLLDRRVKRTLESMEELESYVKKLPKIFSH